MFGHDIAMKLSGGYYVKTPLDTSHNTVGITARVNYIRDRYKKFLLSKMATIHRQSCQTKLTHFALMDILLSKQSLTPQKIISVY